MPARKILVLLLVSVFLLVVADALAQSRHSSSPTILISFDGAQPKVIERLLREGKLSKEGGFAKLIREGTKAEGMTSVLPTLTATNHITIATGAYPEQTNIPMNTFHDTETALTTTVSGFGAPINAETLWEASKRQGKKVITIAFAGPMGEETIDGGIKRSASASATVFHSSSL
jgi:hypothetical protein